MPPKKTPTIGSLAKELLSWRRDNNSGATILLGAGASRSSGIPGWEDLATEICEEYELGSDPGNAISVLVEHLNDPAAPYSLRYSYLRKYLERATPSRGYWHLAQLVQTRFISTILTTNWDPLVEIALSRSLQPYEYQVLVRGQMDDATIAEALKWRGDQVTLVKLHGDLTARQFMITSEETVPFAPPLAEALVERLSRLTFIVGQSLTDVDVLQALLSRTRVGTLFHIRHGDETQISTILQKAGARALEGSAPSVTARDVKVDLGTFDEFATQLNLAVQLRRVEEDKKSLQRAGESILAKEVAGLGYISGARVKELISAFTARIRKQKPGAVLFIDDPSAPGGMELKRRMGARLEKDGITVASIEIQGEGRSRVHRRAVTSDLEGLDLETLHSVMIVDSITFSGNTMRMARDAVEAAFPGVTVTLGVLIVSQQLVDRLAVEPTSDDLIFEAVTDRFEIFFPWGVTQTTGEFDRRFDRTLGESERIVHVSRRPWGAIEILANQENASVRLLSIEAQGRLSFQRHLCRDELFVALDDNIGLDICAGPLPEDVDPYDERIESLVLEKGDYVLIPRGVWHRTKASMDRVRLLEVAFGLYDQDSDIQRRWDDFERQGMDGAA